MKQRDKPESPARVSDEQFVRTKIPEAAQGTGTGRIFKDGYCDENEVIGTSWADARSRLEPGLDDLEETYWARMTAQNMEPVETEEREPVAGPKEAKDAISNLGNISSVNRDCTMDHSNSHISEPVEAVIIRPDIEHCDSCGQIASFHWRGWTKEHGCWPKQGTPLPQQVCSSCKRPIEPYGSEWAHVSPADFAICSASEVVPTLLRQEEPAKPCHCGGEACIVIIGKQVLRPGFVCVREAGLKAIKSPPTPLLEQDGMELIPQIKYIQGLVNDESSQQVVLRALEALLKSAYRTGYPLLGQDEPAPDVNNLFEMKELKWQLIQALTSLSELEQQKHNDGVTIASLIGDKQDLQDQLAQAEASLAAAKLAVGLVLKLHGCIGSNCTEKQYLKDAEEVISEISSLRSKLATALAEIEELKKEGR